MFVLRSKSVEEEEKLGHIHEELVKWTDGRTEGKSRQMVIGQLLGEEGRRFYSLNNNSIWKRNRKNLRGFSSHVED